MPAASLIPDLPTNVASSDSPSIDKPQDKAAHDKANAIVNDSDIAHSSQQAETGSLDATNVSSSSSIMTDTAETATTEHKDKEDTSSAPSLHVVRPTFHIYELTDPLTFSTSYILLSSLSRPFHSYLVSTHLIYRDSYSLYQPFRV